MSNSTDYTLEKCVGMDFSLKYENVKGEKTKRIMTLNTVEKSDAGDWSMKGHCHKRNAERTFRADRIHELTHMGTGEIFADAQVFLAGLVGASPVSKTLRAAMPSLQVLAFLAWCDGDFHKRERAVIEEWAARFVKDKPEADRVEAHADLAKFMAAPFEDTQAFYTAIDRFEKGDIEDLKALISTVRHIVDADDRLANEEFSWLLEMENTLGALSSE